MEKGTTYKVLDFGYVKYIDSMGTDETIIEAARMSTKKSFVSWEPYRECANCGRVELYSEEQKSHRDLLCSNHKMVVKEDGDQGLLEYLWKNRHSTPFEMCELTIEVQAPIGVFREWHRSRTQSYNEMSARYTVMPDLHYVPERKRFEPNTSKNKQEASTNLHSSAEAPDNFRLAMEAEQKSIYGLYERMISGGVPKEVARFNTPVSRYSKMRAKTDLRNWLHFLDLRMRPNAQWEIRRYANIVGNIIAELWPRTYSLFIDYTLEAVSLSRFEVMALKKFFEAGGGTSEQLYEEADKHMSPKAVRGFLDKVRKAP